MLSCAACVICRSRCRDLRDGLNQAMRRAVKVRIGTRYCRLCHSRCMGKVHAQSMHACPPCSTFHAMHESHSPPLHNLHFPHPHACSLQPLRRWGIRECASRATAPGSLRLSTQPLWGYWGGLASTPAVELAAAAAASLDDGTRTALVAEATAHPEAVAAALMRAAAAAAGGDAVARLPPMVEASHSPAVAQFAQVRAAPRSVGLGSSPCADTLVSHPHGTVHSFKETGMNHVQPSQA